ncbi:MAG: ABC transporter ATP-binding protein [Chloroflexi bacterium]|nr:ABC transporter ATP-binding protein [Chloroflexota bacterium]MCL5076188.1 ABC transporter ATP-binding protein [Chloroflexota bacterium]
MRESILEIKTVQVRYGNQTVLDIPHLSIKRGEILSIIGPNGSGKSTLLRVLALLERPSVGEIIFDGQPVHPHSDFLALRRRLAIVFQEALLRDTSVFNNVATGLHFRGVSREATREKVQQWLERLGIAHLQRRSARTLSGGEAQRVSLARALVLEPEILLLDEPFGGLDSPSKGSLIGDLDRILAETRMTVIFVTHDRTEALMLGDRIAVVMDGRILQLDTPQKVFTSPADEAVAAFVGVETILPGCVRVQKDGLAGVEIGDKRIEVVGEYLIGEHVLVCLRPEDVIIAPSDDQPSRSSMRNNLRGVVRRITPLGSQFRVEVDCGFPIVALITKQSFIDLSLAEGRSVLVSFKASAAHVIRKGLGHSPFWTDTTTISSPVGTLM